MPVYEFYCPDCHTIFNFLSRRVNTDARPACPRCARPDLERQVSRFAFSRGRGDEPGPEGMPELDETRLERAMMALAPEMEGLDENDPRQMARFMRKFSDSTGLDLGEGFHEAISRLEAGEDPDRIEEEMGGLFDEADPLGGNPFSRQGIRGLKRKYVPPAHDETLYTLP
jgi:putative FmdB family regulatory protein